MIADMLGARVANQITSLRAVRPVNGSRHDQYPWIAYETVEMRNRRRLNCASRKFDGVVRMYISGDSYAQVNTIAESVKDELIGHTESGDRYEIKRVNLRDETDIAQASEEDETFFVKSIDFQITAVKTA